MDTKLKKSHKLATLLIVLCAIIPALLLVGLYPKMEKAMLEKREYYQEQRQKLMEEEPRWVIPSEFINYGMEASYYLYSQTSARNTGYDILREYNWTNDYDYVRKQTTYIASCIPLGATEAIVQKNAEVLDAKAAKLTLEFDAFGNLTVADIVTEQGVEVIDIHGSIYEEAVASMEQFYANAIAYGNDYDIEGIVADVYVPKNFKIEIAVNEESGFVVSYADYYGDHSYWWYNDAEQLYAETGAYFAVLGLALLVMLAAFILPFFKKLDTGREKIFSLPFEVMCCVAIGGIALTVGMALIMSHSTMWELTNAFENHALEFLGTKISIDVLYKLLLAGNFIGWAVSFFLIYMMASAIRQMVTRPLYYIKNQVLSVRILRWIKRKCIQLYRYMTNIDINEKLNSSIIKIVIANFVILTILCCMWFFGIAGLLVYSIALYLILRKEGEKIQTQYKSILHATEQMADGDLKISLEKDLGVFEPIGESLERVQQGFKKAVMEEAKSQNMKTELITNVSHDLKTPLTAIITYVDLLKKEDITEEERNSYIATLEQKSQRLKVLIEDLFEVSKAHSGNVKMNFMDVDVVSLLKQVRSEMDEQIQESQLQFRWRLPEEKIILSLDGQRTYRVFENLLNNILKYAMPYSRVYIDVIPQEMDVKILFRNVSAMELNYDVENLTERFVRGDAARNSEGSGLGLAIVKSFVELQNGTFRVEGDGDLFKAEIIFRK